MGSEGMGGAASLHIAPVRRGITSTSREPLEPTSRIALEGPSRALTHRSSCLYRVRRCCLSGRSVDPFWAAPTSPTFTPYPQELFCGGLCLVFLMACGVSSHKKCPSGDPFEVPSCCLGLCAGRAMLITLGPAVQIISEIYREQLRRCRAVRRPRSFRRLPLHSPCNELPSARAVPHRMR